MSETKIILNSTNKLDNNKEKSKKLIFTIIIFTLTLILCFVMLEYGFAKFYYSNKNLTKDKMFDPEIGWRLRPGTYWTKPSHTFSKHKIYINKFGLRNKDITVNKNKENKRIILLGDSQAYGRAVRNEDVFPAQLEENLNQIFSNKYEVVNAGVQGYGTAQELLLMKRLSDKNIVGDIYLLTICPNDILDNLRLSYGNLIENLVQPGFVLGYNGKIKLKKIPQKRIKDNSENLVSVKKKRKGIKTFDILKIKLQSFVQTRPSMIEFLNKIGINVQFPRMPGLINGWYKEDILEAGIPLMKGIIEEIRNEVDRKNSRFLISLIPSPVQVYPDTYGPILKRTFPDNKQIDNWRKDITKPQRIVRKICEELNIPFLDLYPILYKNNNDALYIPGDGHFNKRGHTLVAHSLENFITLIESDEERDQKNL